jgi:hypothetical protein
MLVLWSKGELMRGPEEIPVRVVDGVVVGGWASYFTSLVLEVNQILETVALLLSIIASGFAIYYHLKKLVVNNNGEDA